MALKTLTEVFSQSFFRIPDYQRGYCWNENELNDLWIDLERLRSDALHFTGTIILQNLNRDEINDDVERWIEEIDLDFFFFDETEQKWNIKLPNQRIYKPYYIVDGQQRLTTLVILLKCIAEQLKEIGKVNLAKEVEQLFIFEEYQQNKLYFFGYEKDIPCHQWMIDKIYNSEVENPEPESYYTHKLDFAKSFFRNKLRENDDFKFIESLYSKICNQLKFHIYELDKGINVSMVFETLNNRGKSLSTLEILKNRLVYLVDQIHPNHSAELRRAIVLAWQEIYQNLGSDAKLLDDDEFLRAHWIVYFSDLHKENFTNEKFKQYKSYLLDTFFVFDNYRNLTIDKIKGYLNSISEASKYWIKIKNPTNEKVDNTTVNFWQQKINTLKKDGGGFFEPIILASYLVSDITVNQRVELLKGIEEYIYVVFSICNFRSNYSREHFYKMASEFYFKGSQFLDNVLTEIHNKKQNSYSDDRFHTNIHDNPQNTEAFKSWKGLDYLLVEYEYNLSNEIKDGNFKQIFPNPKENNVNGWGNVVLNYGETNLQKLHESLGNQFFRSKNQNQTPANYTLFLNRLNLSKNLFASEIELTQRCPDDFTDYDIFHRGERLIDFMEKRWGFQMASNSVKKILLPKFTFNQNQNEVNNFM